MFCFCFLYNKKKKKCKSKSLKRILSFHKLDFHTTQYPTIHCKGLVCASVCVCSNQSKRHGCIEITCSGMWNACVKLKEN